MKAVTAYVGPDETMLYRTADEARAATIVALLNERVAFGAAMLMVEKRREIVALLQEEETA